MKSLKAMYDAGNVAIVQGAGYPKPDHSHFRSTEIWLRRLAVKCEWPTMRIALQFRRPRMERRRGRELCLA